MLQNFIDIIAAPVAVIARLRAKPSVWLPFVLMIALQMSITLGYFAHNDIGFIRDQAIAQQVQSREMTREQRQQIEQAIGKLALGALSGISLAALVIIIPVVLCLNAWYLSFMGKFSFTELSFKHWLSLLCWTSIPALFAVLAAWVVLLTNDNGQVSQLELQPLSIASLLGYSLKSQTLQSFNLAQLWSLGLLALAYSKWTKTGLFKSILITTAPYIVIYGAIAYFTL